MERWKAIEGYEGLYEVSDMGNVKSLRKGRNLKPCNNGNGYMVINLRLNGKSKTTFVHRLVCGAFHGKHVEGLFVNHKNGVRDDNRVSNLEWVTQQENNADMVKRGTHQYDKAMFKFYWQKRERYVECLDRDGNPLAVFNSIKKASDSLGICYASIHKACNGARKKAGGFGWRYVK